MVSNNNETNDNFANILNWEWRIATEGAWNIYYFFSIYVFYFVETAGLSIYVLKE